MVNLLYSYLLETFTKEKGNKMLVSRARFGAAVAEARAKAGMTQAELASRAGMDEATIAALEQGHYKPASHELSQLAEALGVDELELLRRPAPGYLII